MNKALIEKIATCANWEAAQINSTNDSMKIIEEIFAKFDDDNFKTKSVFEAGKLYEKITQAIKNIEQMPNTPLNSFDSTELLEKLTNETDELEKEEIINDEFYKHLRQSFAYGYLKAIEDTFEEIKEI